MPLYTYTLEEVFTIVNKCVNDNDRDKIGDLANQIAEDGNLYTELDLDRIIRYIESAHQKLS